MMAVSFLIPDSYRYAWAVPSDGMSADAFVYFRTVEHNVLRPS